MTSSNKEAVRLALFLIPSNGYDLLNLTKKIQGEFPWLLPLDALACAVIAVEKHKAASQS